MFTYRSDEDIRSGDRILFHDEEAEVEFIADSHSEAETQWFFRECGGGVMIDDPKVSGRTFVPAGQIDEDLIFVSRAKSNGS